MNETLQVKHAGKVYTFIYIHTHQGKEYQIRDSDDHLAVSVLFPTEDFADWVADNIPDIMRNGL